MYIYLSLYIYIYRERERDIITTITINSMFIIILIACPTHGGQAKSIGTFTFTGWSLVGNDWSKFVPIKLQLVGVDWLD